jgi:excisionase family DNA binding protein
MKNNDELLTIAELSNLLNVKPSWLRSMVFKKQIPFLKIGKHIRFSKAEIQKWIEERKIQEEAWN